MRIIQDEGVVLRNQPFGESDIIVSIITRKHGRLTCIAKGAKRSKKRFGVNIQPLSQSNFRLVDKGVNYLLRIDSCELIRYRENLSSSIENFVNSEYAIELIYKLLPEREENENIFILLLWYLDNINSRKNSELLVRAFESRLFTYLGYKPNLSLCGGCGTDSWGEYVIFRPDEGRVYCEKCVSLVVSARTGVEIRRKEIRVKSSVIDLFKLLTANVDIDKFERNFTDEVKRDLKNLLWNLIIHINEAPMNSWKLMKY